MRRHLLTSLALLLLLPNLLRAQFETTRDSVVQLFGVVMTADSLVGIPAVSIVVKGQNRGTITNNQGVFSIVVLKGDLVEFSHVSYQGSFVADPAYDEIREAAEGRIPFRLGTAWGFLDLQGKICVEPRYLAVDAFRSGWSRVTLFSGKSGFVDLQGNFVEHRLVGDVPTAAGP